ncbi:hypothetical protein CNMCM5623_002638 [Aspergillus felis]|uniref:Uncharacterized protein n=1 Tax=Aspergillus felis TaxID=1287682 RepID=A0A8H6QCU2_9EURO|nr:hypothetical protein CNMCM5623_002638 [Aspergillus felis]
MLTSGLTNAPITKLLLIYTIASSIALSILDIKHLASIRVSPHLWPYAQFWRLATWQLAGFSNSTEALFAAMLAYHLRVVERAWGKRKFAKDIHPLHATIYLPPPTAAPYPPPPPNPLQTELSPLRTDGHALRPAGAVSRGDPAYVSV